jgi:general secretion pathway protein G
MLAGLGGYYYVRQLDQSKRGMAKSQVTTLTKAAENYYIDHSSNYPPSLNALLQQDEGGGPYLKTPDALVDPWGKPYQYDPSGQHNSGRQPDVWADAPGGPVGNWSGSK